MMKNKEIVFFQVGAGPSTTDACIVQRVLHLFSLQSSPSLLPFPPPPSLPFFLFSLNKK